MISNFKAIRVPAPLLAICGASPFALLSLWNLWTPYSYWIDELYSVVASTGTWQFVIDSLLHDVHPPLYQVILKLWLDLFGPGETQTRILSVLFAFASLAILIAALRDRRPLFLVAVTTFFVSSPLFAYYAQETRGYSLLLLLATAATLQDFRRIGRPQEGSGLGWYMVLFGLSLAHYFGLFLACLLLFGDIIRQEDRRAILERIGLAVLMLAWPVLHLSIGNIGDQMGGNHWIISKGFATTVRMFAEAVFAGPLMLMDQMATLNRTLLLVFVVLISTVLVLMVVQPVLKSSGRARREMFALLVRIGSFVFIIALIDLHTPISWPRYYIVLLPAVALSFGYVVQFWWDGCSWNWQRLLLGLSVLAYVTGAGLHTYKNMSTRWGVDKGWKGLAAVVNTSGICRPHCWFYNESSRLNLYGYYFRPSMGAEPQRTILSLKNLLDLAAQDQLPIVAAHIKGPDIVTLREHYPDWQCLEPRHGSRTNVILLVPKSSAPEGLKACPE